MTALHPRQAGLVIGALLACTLFPSGTPSRRECEHRERQGVQHPEVWSHVEAPPIRRSCAEARSVLRWSELPCGPDKGQTIEGAKPSRPRR
jgi:hypothetical protein